MRTTVCECCGEGIRPSRAIRWASPNLLFRNKPCVSSEGLERLASDGPLSPCETCQLGTDPDSGDINLGQGQHILLWIGEKFYPTPQDWLEEAGRMGVSRRITGVPKGFKVGTHWVLVAHRKAVRCDTCSGTGNLIINDKMVDCHDCVGHGAHPGIFQMFKPTAVEYVVKGDEDEAKLEKMRKRGITPVQVVPVGKQREIAEVGA